MYSNSQAKYTLQPTSSELAGYALVVGMALIFVHYHIVTVLTVQNHHHS